MSWRNVWLVWMRELRDQLRDRRTLFMVAVLPLLMYPLLGAVFLQLAQFLQQHTATVVVLGGEQFEGAPGLPPLLDGDRFAADLFDTPEQAGRLRVRRVSPRDPLGAGGPLPLRDALSRGEIDAAVYFREGFAARLLEQRTRLTRERAERGADSAARGGALFLTDPPPKPMVMGNAAREASQVAQLRVERVLARWQDRIVRGNLEASGVPEAATRPFEVERQDVSSANARDAAMWSKLLPFIVFVWALTGAFYPAVDLCAGEKERGTLETLLASPARRSEIVGGKLLTVITFSAATAVLNLASLVGAARFVVAQLGGAEGGGIGLAPPPILSAAWLLVALLPVSALFSALSLACAAFARSTKEGQYYFMPLFLGAMPLILAPMSPGVELNLANSLVPVMGLALVLRALLEGQLAMAAVYAPPVVAVTGVCCWLATRWAVSLFNQESVLFRDGERFRLGGWLASVWRNREATPSPGAAMACVAAIFLLQSLSRLLLAGWAPGEPTFAFFAAAILVSQLVCIALPTLAIAFGLARDWRRTLLIDRAPGFRELGCGALLAVALHPIGQRLSMWVQEAYPLSDAVRAELEAFGALAVAGSPHWSLTLLLIALLPAVCEEAAFRGVVLGGLRKPLGEAGAVIVSAVLFGLTHTILQQSLTAAPVGVVLGVVALRTGRLGPCIAFHAVYNALPLVLGPERLAGAAAALAPWGGDRLLFTEIAPGQVCYAPAVAMLGAVVAVALLRGVAAASGSGVRPENRVRATA